MPNTPRHPELAPTKPSRRKAPDRSGAAALVEAQPFLKWAGGKSQLLEQFEPFFPQSISSYCEPFLGGGAVFFHLKARFPKMRVVLCDNNSELINCYLVVRDQVQELMARLNEHREQFRTQAKPYYYEVRAQLKKTNIPASTSLLGLPVAFNKNGDMVKKPFGIYHSVKGVFVRVA